MDWIDQEKQRRDQMITQPLTQEQHAAVNSRHQGCTLEYCCECGGETGKAGAGEDSLYTDGGEGPYCEECWAALSDMEQKP